MSVSRQAKSGTRGRQRSRERVVAVLEHEALRRNLRAVEEVRATWARELHDDTLQGLGALRMMLREAQRREDVESMREALESAVARVGQEIANLRLLITELRPAALDQLGLGPALDALFERTREAHEVEVASSVTVGRGLDPELETVVYRVIQESLTNAVRHSGAGRIEVEVSDADQLRIEVRDDGSGFDVGARSGGFGLSGMRERVALAGGRLEIASSAAGTRIRAALPSGGQPSASAGSGRI